MILFCCFRRIKKYPEVKFLSYKDRKRILVCIHRQISWLFTAKKTSTRSWDFLEDLPNICLKNVYFIVWNMCLLLLLCHWQVTGGAGFIGSHLVDTLMLMGHEVTVVDNFFTGRKRNIEQWIGHENFALITHDIVTPLHLESQFLTMILCIYMIILCSVQ